MRRLRALSLFTGIAGIDLAGSLESHKGIVSDTVGVGHDEDRIIARVRHIYLTVDRYRGQNIYCAAPAYSIMYRPEPYVAPNKRTGPRVLRNRASRQTQNQRTYRRSLTDILYGRPLLIFVISGYQLPLILIWHT